VVIEVRVEPSKVLDEQKMGWSAAERANGQETKTYLSSSSGGGTISSTPGMRMLPCGSTSLLMRAMRSVMGSCTMRPKAPEWRSLAGPEMVNL
jgi:hypothetical protein